MKRWVCGLLLMLPLLSHAEREAVPQPLSLKQAVAVAVELDPWLKGSSYREQALAAKAVAAGELPDPKMSVSLANFSLDDWRFDAEPMTQFKVGVSQVLPRGDSRMLMRQQFSQMGAQQPLLRRDREAMVAAKVAQLWLEAFKNQQTIVQIEKDRGLFEHLVDVAETSYTSALGKTRQQDLVRAQLELTRLEDRLTQLQQKQHESLAQLGEWLGHAPLETRVTEAFPEIALADSDMDQEGLFAGARISEILSRHPAVLGLEQQVRTRQTGVDLARQNYKPQWGIEAGYAYREDDPIGRSRSDFLSLGVTFDLPLFTERRQDQQLRAAIAEEEASKTDKALLLRSMRARFEAAQVRFIRLSERERLYAERLLQEVHEQAEASLSAYTNDDGDFAEVVRARIAELNANIDYLTIRVDRLKTIAELNYFFASAPQGALEE